MIEDFLMFGGTLADQLRPVWADLDPWSPIPENEREHSWAAFARDEDAEDADEEEAEEDDEEEDDLDDEDLDDEFDDDLDDDFDDLDDEDLDDDFDDFDEDDDDEGMGGQVMSVADPGNCIGCGACYRTCAKKAHTHVAVA
jgi:NAD-dependent dihydropyrimidine dehydrogenase PreA subunit